MKTYWVVRILLAVHILGIVIMGGTTIIDYLTFVTLWDSIDHNESNYFGLLPLMATYGDFVRTGAVLIIITGLTMLILKKGILWKQFRFKIKIILVILLSLNGLLVGNRYGHQLRDAIEANAIDFILSTSNIREILNRFYLMQLTLFIIIIFTSVVKSNQVINRAQDGKVSGV